MQEADDIPKVTVESSSTTGEETATGANKGIGLCLSGGGYRAALFHLGVLRCLHEMGILQTVRTVSSVSGGSIISAYVAKRMFDLGIKNQIRFTNWEKDVSAGFREFVKNDIRTFPTLLHLLWNWYEPKWRVRHLQRNYDKLLLTVNDNATSRSFTLGDLPTEPNFVYCSTDLTFGVNFIFKRDRVGDYLAGYAKKNDWPVAKAVAASSCFPPLFGPFKLDLDPNEFRGGEYDQPNRNLLVQELRTTDGGVYDNIGFEPVKRHATVLVSDGGSPFGYMGTAGPVKRLMRYLPVIMNQVASLRKRIFFTGITKGWNSGAYIDIAHERTSSSPTNSFDGYVDPGVRSMIAAIRTDLDRFSEAEAGILENHGYFEVYRRILGKLPQLVPPGFKPTTPHPNLISCKAVIEALKDSDKRKIFFIRL